MALRLSEVKREAPYIMVDNVYLRLFGYLMHVQQ